MEAGYFDELYPGQHIIASFAAWNMAALVFTQFFLVIWGTRFPVGCRVVTGFGMLLGALLLAIPAESAAMHKILVVVLAIGDGIVQGSVYGFAGQISPFHTSAVMSGNGASGTIVSLLSLSTAGTFEDNHTAFVFFFLLCAMQIALCIVSWFYMRTLAEANELRRTCTFATWVALCCPERDLESDDEPSPPELELDVVEKEDDSPGVLPGTDEEGNMLIRVTIFSIWYFQYLVSSIWYQVFSI